MNNANHFNVISTAQIVEGFRPEQVHEHLVSVMKLPPDQAQRFFDKPRILKRGLEQSKAERFCQRLEKLGIQAVVKSATTASALTQPGDIPTTPMPKPATSEFDLAIVQDEPAASGNASHDVQCPNCQHRQPAAEQCEQCGIWFHKFEALSRQASSLQPVAAGAMAAQSANTDNEASEAAPADRDAFHVKALAAAAVAALVGAWLWKFIGVTFDYELGLVAWAIGGGVGFAAASLGSRGIPAGMICGVLVVLAIVLGKYWTYSTFRDDLQQMMASVAEQTSEFQTIYEQQHEDALILVAGTGSDAFVRQFMVERGYSYAPDAAGVSAEELREFREYTEPELREIAASQPDYEAWKNNNIAAIGDISPWAMMRENFGIIDLIFLFLGVGTAFRLASQQG